MSSINMESIASAGRWVISSLRTAGNSLRPVCEAVVDGVSQRIYSGNDNASSRRKKVAAIVLVAVGAFSLLTGKFVVAGVVCLVAAAILGIMAKKKMEFKDLPPIFSALSERFKRLFGGNEVSPPQQPILHIPAQEKLTPAQVRGQEPSNRFCHLNSSYDLNIAQAFGMAPSEESRNVRRLTRQFQHYIDTRQMSGL